MWLLLINGSHPYQIRSARCRRLARRSFTLAVYKSLDSPKRLSVAAARRRRAAGGRKEWFGRPSIRNQRQQPPGKPAAWHTAALLEQFTRDLQS